MVIVIRYKIVTGSVDWFNVNRCCIVKHTHKKETITKFHI